MQGERKALRPYLDRLHYTDQVYDLFEDLADAGYGATFIYDQMEPLQRKGVEVPVDKRAIEKWLVKYRELHADRPWRLSESNGDDARLIFESLRAVMVTTEGRVTAITVKEAEWIVRLRRALPQTDRSEGLNPWTAYTWARRAVRGALPDGMLEAALAHARFDGDTMVIGVSRASLSAFPQREAKQEAGQ